MDLTGYSPKDAKVIRENEGAPAYQLLQLGLSKGGYEKYIKDLEAIKAAPRPRSEETTSSPDFTGKVIPSPTAQEAPAAPPMEQLTASVEYKPADAPITPDTVEVKKAHQPKLGPTQKNPPTAGQQSVFQQVTIIGPSGIPQKMAVAAAQRLQRLNPKDYRILD